MCGIAGIYHYGEAARPVVQDELSSMAHALRHRGPDDEGFYLNANLGLAHRRLSIIDLSGGHQPIANEDKSLWVICNGEIYDFQRQIKMLESKGHHFSSRSDSEIIVHLYEEKGPEFINELRGMFAFALWDEPRRRLILGRDRLGKKPLYYYADGKVLAFASELKAIEARFGSKLHLNDQVLAQYLNLGFFPAPETKYQEIKKLPPAHYLLAENGVLRLERYWHHPYPAAGNNGAHLDWHAAKESLREKLREAVKIRLEADVPLGAFLSGGVDSSLIVALMSELSSKPVKTFNVTFAERTYDESLYAKRVAQHLHTEHHELSVDPRARDLIEKVLRHFDEPFADSSAIPQYLVSQAARRYVTVALSGDAGDEVFGGYRRYVGRKLTDHYNHLLPAELRHQVFQQARRRIREGDEYIGRSAPKLLMRFLNLARHYEIEPHNPCIPFFSQEQIRSLLDPEIYGRQNLTLPTAALYRDDRDGVAQMLYIDQQVYLPDDILVKVDRMSMAHALEVRSPLLDHVLIEWAAGLSLDAKVRRLSGKVLLKKLAEDYVPKEVLYRPKQGFAVPLAQWFRGELKDFVRDELLPATLERLDRGAITTLIEEHQSGRRDWSQQLWALLSLKYTFGI